ncbi:hypothetical protein [Eilatimonas milleporae]|uniref:Uncharacterized protein n=1 Tax=Eilatimonas milleporae TaxID=911205 RepID=A0A3M0BVT2_9PROT|nr:hypothetical protein [Eilatimonas milleporae]RMB01498.1 hypothetical protein BXY39_3685 [Eilatimonas milleporae]
MSGPSRKSRRVRKPFSLGLYDEERAQIEHDAGTLPLGVYIRGKLLDGSELNRPVRRSHRPTVDHVALAKLLGTFGQSEVFRSLLALSLAAQSGALPVDKELTDKLIAACDDVREMRCILIAALGLKVEG